jgi:hypothetical protein
MRNLASVEDDAFKQDFVGGPKPDLGYFLGYEPGLAKVHVG